MNFKVTKETVNANKVLTPGWYVCRVSKVEIGKTSKTSGALMDVIYFAVSDHAGNPKLKDGGSSTGVPIRPVYISEAAEIGYSLPVLSAITKKEIKEGDDIDTSFLANAVDVKLKIYVKNGEYRGKLNNEAEDFKAL